MKLPEAPLCKYIDVTVATFTVCTSCDEAMACMLIMLYGKLRCHPLCLLCQLQMYLCTAHFYVRSPVLPSPCCLVLCGVLDSIKYEQNRDTCEVQLTVCTCIVQSQTMFAGLSLQVKTAC